MLGMLRKLLGQEQQKVTAQPQKPQPKQYITRGGGTSQFNPNSVTNAGNLTPRYEDGYDTTIKYMQGSLGRGRNPVDMGAVPTNFTAGRTGYFQGSNPYVNGQNWVDPQMQDFAPGGGIQSPSFGAWPPKKRY
jgi:hypothetical protein